MSDPERSLVAAVRRAAFPAFCLPVALASLGASATGVGLQLALAGPLAALALFANVACWLKVVVLWRALPPREDDDQGWSRWRDRGDPLDPTGGPGGIGFDWDGFERDFRSYVRENELAPSHA
jgi:hypothetical protein